MHLIPYSALHILWTVRSKKCTVPNNNVSNRKLKVGHVARIGERRGFWLGILREKDHLEDPGLDGRIILK